MGLLNEGFPKDASRRNFPRRVPQIVSHQVGFTKGVHKGIPKWVSQRSTQGGFPGESHKRVPQSSSPKDCPNWGSQFVSPKSRSTRSFPEGDPQSDPPMGVPQGIPQRRSPKCRTEWASSRCCATDVPHVGFPIGCPRAVSSRSPHRVFPKVGTKEGLPLCSLGCPTSGGYKGGPSSGFKQRVSGKGFSPGGVTLEAPRGAN
jgi:hypothetical protein